MAKQSKNLHRRALVLSLLGSAISSLPVMAQVKAFPEAEGFGRFSTGGRGGSVYHVTNLNDSGPGSFRDAIGTANRTVVFDIGGRITTGARLICENNVTIAGQTAPGGGIEIYGNGMSFSNANNTIVRGIRVRMGVNGDSGADAITIASGNNMIFDHLSVTWGRDETFSMSGTAANITVQNTVIGQGLTPHSCGGLVETDGGTSFLRNLFIDNDTRNAKVKGVNQFVNNVVYNWDDGAYILGDSAGLSYANVEGNYFISGPVPNSAPFTRGNTNFHIYANNNVFDGNENGLLDGNVVTQAEYGTVSWENTPFDYPQIATLSPQAAYEYVKNKVGPKFRDQVDQRLIDELASLGTLGQHIRHEFDAPFNGYPVGFAIDPGTAPVDTDQDGMPNAWETAKGLNPNDAADRNNLNAIGYTRLEEYLNELAVTHTDKIWTASSGTWPTDTGWQGLAVSTFDDDAFIQGTGPGNNGNVTISAPGAAAFRLYIGGNGSPLGETLTLNAGGTLSVLDTLHIGHANNATMTVNSGAIATAYAILLGNTGFNGNLVVQGGTLSTNYILAAGGTGTVIFNGGTLLANGGLQMSANANIGSLGLVIDGNGSSGTISGNLSGAGTLTAQGDGTLNLTGSNSFAGGLVLKGGSLGITNDANVGGPTAPITFIGGMLRINGTTLTNLALHPFNSGSFNGGFDIAAAANTFTVSQNLAGTGSLTKAGAGKLILSGSNSYTGGTVVNGGTLEVSSDSNLGANGSPLTFTGGALRINGTTLANLNNHPLAGGNVAGTIDIANAAHTFAINQSINGTGTLTKVGPGTLTLGAHNYFNGDMVLTAGTVKLANALAMRFMTANFNGGSIDFGGVTNVTIGGIAGAGAFNLKGMDVYAGNSDTDETYSGVLSSSVAGASLIKIGSGTMNLTGASTFDGPFIIAEGRINVPSIGNVGANGPLGPGSSAASLVLDGGMLRYSATATTTTDRLFTLGAGGGTLNSGSGTVGWNSTGSISFTGDGDRTLTLEGSTTGNGLSFTIGDPAVGKTSLQKTGSGRWIITNPTPFTYSGDTIITQGTFLLQSTTNTVPFGTGKGNVSIAAAGIFDVRQNTNINALNGVGTTTNSSSSGRTLTLGNANASGSFGGIVNGNLSITKTGTGVQVLTASNSYTGITTINSGALQFNAANSIAGTGANVTVNSPGAAAAGYAIDQAFLGRIVTTSTGAAALAANSANALSFASFPSLKLGAVGNVSYTGALTPNGTIYRLGGGLGTLTLPNANALTGARELQVFAGGTIALTSTNDLTGKTTINPGGVLSVATLANGGAPSAIGAGTIDAANLILDGGTLKVTGVLVSTDRLFTLTANGGTLESSGSTTWAGPGAPTVPAGGNRTLTLAGTSNTNNFIMDLIDPVGGKTSLTKTGGGRWFFGGTSRGYSGDTTVNAGTLHLTAPDLLPVGLGKGNLVINGGIVSLGNLSTSINALAGTGGSLIQGGTNTRSLTLGNGNASGTFTGALSGSGAFGLVKNGTGTQALLGANTWGSTTVNDGTLILGAASIGAITVNGGMLKMLAKPQAADPSGTVVTTGFSMPGGKIDLGNNAMIVEYSTTSPIETLRQSLSTGIAGGNGLMSSMTDATHRIGYGENSELNMPGFGGASPDASAILVRYTLTGDADLNGTIATSDFTLLATNFNQAGQYWNEGDFNYDGIVNALDFNALASNFGQTMAAPLPIESLGSLVPEPGALAILMAALPVVGRRRRCSPGSAMCSGVLH